MKSSKPLVVAIMGPTASGKTSAALAIAKSIPCEIISVDSALIYRGMDIGTAKPSDEERSQVPHHLIDILDPSHSYSVKQFRDDASRLITDIQARYKLPLLVGGTMLYFKALRDGLDDLPSADLALRSQLDMEIARHGTAALHARLRELDPITAERLNPNDTQRVQRAMEIILLSGQPMSSQLDKADKPELPFELMSLALEPSDRKVLHDRIAQRFDAMLSAKPGLIEETATLKQRSDLHSGLPSIRCVGYRQAWDYLDGKINRDNLREMGIAATRQLAKRQLTWLRSMPDRHVIDCLSPNPTEQILSLVTAKLG
ncbi:MAG: tRNA ((37)-N6)-dimethylallyltransferase MiaA [Pseudomonadota bacterium]